MAEITSGVRPLQWLMREWDPDYNRDEGTLEQTASTVLATGRVLGQITANSKYVLVDPVAVDGSEVAAGILCFEADVGAADVQAAVIVRGPVIVKSADLDWGTLSAGEIATATAELLTLGIKVV